MSFTVIQFLALKFCLVSTFDNSFTISITKIALNDLKNRITLLCIPMNGHFYLKLLKLDEFFYTDNLSTEL